MQTEEYHQRLTLNRGAEEVHVYSLCPPFLPGSQRDEDTWSYTYMSLDAQQESSSLDISEYQQV